MKQEEEIGKLFHDKLAGFEQAPPEGMWNSIQNNPDLKKFNRSRRFRKTALRMALPAVVILITAITLFFTLSPESPQKPGIQTKPATTVQNTLPVQPSTPSVTTPEPVSTLPSSSPSPAHTSSLPNTESQNTAAAETSDATITTHPTPLPVTPDETLSSDNHTQPAVTTKNTPPQKQGLSSVATETSPVTTQHANHSPSTTLPTNHKTGELPLRFSHDTSVCRNSKITLFVENAAEIRWSTGTQMPTLDLYIEDPITISADIHTKEDLDTTIYITISVFDCGLFIPNAFTPNGDGLNDEWLVSAPMGITNYECVVFDKMSRHLFQSKNIHVGWNGTSSDGKLLPPGAYFYVITYLDEMGNKHVEKGQVVIAR
ncbi:MAG: gliding motility-associated C-terminal domain-containing protein [Bacteroidales bacterium]|nr:gliding motility-associated C-terminal domain-containing protein [Bacteroidales bacterium]